MGQCKICGKEIEDGLEYCEECQAEMTDVDLDGIDLDLDLDVDDFDLLELSGDLLETDLEFQLEDPNNNLENPNIVIREKEEGGLPDELQDASETLESLPEPEGLPTLEELPEAVEEMVESEPELVAEESEGIDLAELELPDINMEEELSGADMLPDTDALPEPEEEEVIPMIAEEDSASDSLGLELDALTDEAETEDGIGELNLDGLLPEGLMEEVIAPEPEEETAAEAEIGGLSGILGGMEDLLGGDVDLGIDTGGPSIADAIGAEGGIEELDTDIDMLGELPDAEAMAEMSEPKPKISFWKRLFGNIKDEKWEKQKEKEAKLEAEKQAKLEAKKAEAEAAAAGGEGEEGGEAKIDPKEAKKAEKLAKKEEKARRKEERKAEKLRQKELAAAEDDDEGRINRVGAAIVFVFFGIVCAFIIAGTNMFAYKNSVSHAKTYFKEDEYQAAYNELCGMELKEKDEELYQKVRTVMYVDKQLNSYHNYSNIRMYPEALDSLIKGIRKYDAHYQEAIELEVTEDFQKVRSTILTELKNEYNLSEEEVYRLIAMEDHAAYSTEVISIANN